MLRAQLEVGAGIMSLAGIPLIPPIAERAWHGKPQVLGAWSILGFPQGMVPA